MNCPSRNDETLQHEGWNQSPPRLAADLTTTEDLNGRANSRERRGHTKEEEDMADEGTCVSQTIEPPCLGSTARSFGGNSGSALPNSDDGGAGGDTAAGPSPTLYTSDLQGTRKWGASPTMYCCKSSAALWAPICRLKEILIKYTKFVGPGFLISVAYIDPGNYATDVGAGAQTKFSLLFVVLMSNLFAIFLQSLCIKLGTVTGLNLAENCKAHLPRWLNITLYVFAETAIVATDIAEVCSLCLNCQTCRL